MSDGILTQNNILPFRQYAEAEVINQYALLGTGLNGMLVSYVTGNQNPDNADGYSTQGIGATYTNIQAPLYLNNRRVRAAVAGDTKFEIAGITLNTTAINDENGLPILLMPPSDRLSRGFVATGETVPFVKRGKFWVKLSQIQGTPLAGYPVVATGAGQFAVLTPASGNTTTYTNLVVGRCVSSSGSNNGGYAEIEISV
jgi:hypothetical protein